MSGKNNKVVKSVDKRKPPAAGMGRKKGSLNKTTRSVKEAIEYAAQGLGGAERLIAWAKEDAKNESAFWSSIYPKLLPLTVASDPENPLVVQIVRMADASKPD